MQALLPPVVLLQDVLRTPETEEVIETLQIRVSSVGKGTVSAMNITVPRTAAHDVAGRPPRLPVRDYEFPPEASPSWTRVERALRGHRTAVISHESVPPPSYRELYPDGPESCRTSVQVPEFPPPSYEVAIKKKNNNLSSAAVYRSIIWPTEPFDSATADFIGQRHSCRL